MKNELFRDLVFYEIYPTSFYDSNDDGIGDLKGIELKLDYIKDLGCNGIWLNPFYDSPFMDGGYDVRDFFNVDKRFGTNEDFKSLCAKAKEKGIIIIVDLVPGHASEENKEFLESAKYERNEYSDMFIWTNSVWNMDSRYRFVSGRHNRDGNYMINFFSVQPAFNYGFKEVTDPFWQLSYKDPRTFKARDYIVSIMKHWASLGASGFRVDMADSLVKDDDEMKSATREVWEYIFNKVRSEYKDLYIVSELGWPKRSFRMGFDADFILDFFDFSYISTFIRKENNVLLDRKNVDKFILELKDFYNDAFKLGGYIANISGNHDEMRIASIAKDKIRSFYLFILSLPGTPFIYYGDEIGMKYSEGLSKDGGYNRTGSRTPMQWDNSLNYGFSKAKELYLPVGLGSNVNLKDEMNDPNSLYHFVKSLIHYRRNSKSLLSDDMEIEYKDNVLYIIRRDLCYILNLKEEEDIKLDKTIIFTSGINNVLKPSEAALIEWR